MTDGDLITLRNIGPRTAEVLHAAGIHSARDLDEIGAIEAWKRIRSINRTYDNLMGLYALQGALMDCEISAMPMEIIADLKAEAAAIRAGEKKGKRK
jgi:DNA transformation protein